MLLKKILIILGIMIVTSLLGASLLLFGNKKDNTNNEIKIYESVDKLKKLDIQNQDEIPIGDVINEEVQNDNTQESINVVENVENQSLNQEVSKVVNKEVVTNNVINNTEKQIQKENITKDNLSNNQEQETKEKQEIENKVQEETKEDVYTFKRNDIEIEKMINIAKSIIKENKNNRCNGLVDKVDTINFITEKSGNLFYPLFDYRIENIVVDNYYPEFYVYAEDVYKNGEYLRTEYYFN